TNRVFFGLTPHKQSNLDDGRTPMLYRNLIAAIVLAAMAIPAGDARALDDGKYPNWKGQWGAVNPPLGGPTPIKFDPTKPWGLAQQAPLTPEYRKVLEDSMADQ